LVVPAKADIPPPVQDVGLGAARALSLLGSRAKVSRNHSCRLYDVSSAAFEGRTCPLGAIGHPKDGVRGRLQIVYGLLTSPEGIPVAIEVFAGNTGDPAITEVLPLLYLHGLSSGDFVPALGQFLGSTAGLSPAVITWLTEQWKAEQRAFAQRDLSAADYVYV